MLPAPSQHPDPASILQRIELMQAELAALRREATEQVTEDGPLSIGERVAVAQHIGVMAASLGVLHKAFRLISEGRRHARG